MGHKRADQLISNQLKSLVVCPFFGKLLYPLSKLGCNQPTQSIDFRIYYRMMINHSTLDYHVTNFNTFSRWLWRTNKTLTLYSDPYPNTNQNPNPNHSPNPNPNVKFDLFPYMAMSRDITWPTQFLAHNFSEKHFNPTSCGVIRNQRSKILRFYIISTIGGPFRKISKFECRVI